MSAAAVNQAAETRADLEKKRNGVKHANSLLKDIVTMRWLVYPASAAKIALIFVLGYMMFEYALPFSAVSYTHL